MEYQLGRLLIFIDECGTMPLNNEKDIFVAAGIGVFNNYPIFTGQKGKKPWLIGQIVKHSAIPFISYIEPDSEYYTKIHEKLENVEKMATATLEITGNNKKYFSIYGMEKRNILWILTVNNCIGRIILNATIKDSIDELVIYLDQKTLQTTSLKLFKNQIERELDIMNGSLKKIENVSQNILAFINSKLKWNKNEIKIIWSNEPEALPATYGLEISHYLGYYFRTDYNKAYSEENLQNRLRKVGYIYHSSKMNSALLGDFSARSIQDWEKNTGLK